MDSESGNREKQWHDMQYEVNWKYDWDNAEEMKWEADSSSISRSDSTIGRVFIRHYKTY